jgi:hypothetical protein
MIGYLPMSDIFFIGISHIVPLPVSSFSQVSLSSCYRRR